VQARANPQSTASPPTAFAPVVAPAERQMPGLRDLWRDWRRWSAAERIGAVVVVLLMAATASLSLVAAHSA